MFAPVRGRSLLSPLRPEFARQWNAAKNRLLRPQAVGDSSTRLAWWTCPRCTHDFRCRVDHHCAANGRCPQCNTAAARPRPKRAPALRTASARRSAAATTHTAAPRKAKPLVIPSYDEPVYARDKRILSPMLASNWRDMAVLFRPDDVLFVSPKMDGIRCIVAYDRGSGLPYFMTRRGTVLESCDLLRDAVAPMFRRDPSLVLDGELYVHGTEFNALAGSVRALRRSATEEHLALQAALQLHVFDTQYAAGAAPGDGFEQRRANYEEILARHRPHTGRRVVAVKHKKIRAADVARQLEVAERRDYEGVMLRAPGSSYVFGKRARTELIKAKTMQDAEFVIVGSVEGQGRLAGSLGALQCRTAWGQVFHASFGGTDEQRAIMWRGRRALVGQAATIRYQDLSPTGIPRFPYFKAVRGSSCKKDWL